METRAGDPGAFARFDLDRVDSPAFVVDAAALRAEVLPELRELAVAGIVRITAPAGPHRLT